MAYYGTLEGVRLEIGALSTDKIFTEANINAALAKADIWVDKINPNATAEHKGIAGDMIAVELLKRMNVNKQLRGLSSDGGDPSKTAKSGNSSNYTPSPAVYKILTPLHKPKVTSVTPKITGEW